MKKKGVKNEANDEDSESITNENSPIIQNEGSNAELPTNDNNIDSMHTEKTTPKSKTIALIFVFSAPSNGWERKAKQKKLNMK